jgi:hypothetical protein
MKKSSKISVALLALFTLSVFSQIYVLYSVNGIVNKSSIETLPDYSQISAATSNSSSYQVNKIIDSNINSIGEVKVVSLDINNEPDFFFGYDYENISFTHETPDFIGTVTNANDDRTQFIAGSRRSDIRVRINETVEWVYNDSVAAYDVGFKPYIQPAILNRMFLNGTLLNSTDYYLSLNNSQGFYYNFENLFTANANGTFILTYEYECDIPITGLNCYTPGPEQYIIDHTQNLTQRFNYNITFGELGNSLDVTAKFNVTLPNYDRLFNTVIDEFDNGTLQSWEYTNHKNQISLVANLSSEKKMGLHFDTNFTVQILEAISSYWSEDRLVDSTSVRERDIKLRVSDGPADLILSYIWLNETEVFFDDLVKSSNIRSALGRPVYAQDMNVSVESIYNYDPIEENEEDEEEDEVVVQYTDGTKLLGLAGESRYYIATNETDIITIRYSAPRTLSIVVTDNINVPLPDYRVNIYYGEMKYGTKINRFHALPYPTKITNENGQILYDWVPAGNFTLEIMDSNGKFVANKTASSLSSLNFLVTDKTHFPSVILVLGGISTGFILLGVVILKKQNKQ